MSTGPSFGRRMSTQPVPLRPGPSGGPKTEPPPSPQPFMPVSSAPEEAIIELRNICLARLDPTAVAAMPEDRLTADVERLISEIATERRVQLNAREQRALAGELVDDILGLGPLEPLLEDETVSEIMVNGPEKTFIERSGKLMMSHVRFRDTQHLSNICQRIASGVGRRIDESSPMVDARLRDGSRVNIVFPPLALDGPYVSIRKFGRKDIDFDKLIEWKAMTRQVARVLEIASQGAAEHHHFRRHRVRQDDAAERDVAPDRPRRAHCDGGGYRGAATAAAARGAPGNPPLQPGRQGRDHPARPDEATRCGCARTGSSSARCAAARRSTCCRR